MKQLIILFFMFTAATNLFHKGISVQRLMLNDVKVMNLIAKGTNSIAKPISVFEGTTVPLVQ